MSPKHYLAVDLGASSGRVMLGQWADDRVTLTEIHRFGNAPVSVLGRQHTDVLYLWTEIQRGLARYALQFPAPLVSLGVDAWGVDFALLDGANHLLGNPYHYRDRYSDGMMERVFERVGREEVFAQTGIQTIPINTLYQLYSLALSDDPQLRTAETLLMLPDLFNYWLTGRMASEYTIASTSQMMLAREPRWAIDLL
ncbi:MAG: rhamnulokinase, partial [Chloroflexi bacterium]|nr:rhamnulokinase [Chloroflexota bacterium]